jgi:hypothetical protein
MGLKGHLRIAAFSHAEVENPCSISLCVYDNRLNSSQQEDSGHHHSQDGLAPVLFGNL